MHISEGYLPFLGHQTHWRVVEPDEELPGRAPLVLLHGGPGSTHNYFEVLDDLADLDGRRLVMYDQLGCGLSWDDGLAGHDELWRADTWLDEFDALRTGLGLDRIHLLGQSWGGMLALMHLVDHGGVGVSSVVLSSTLASASLWSSEGHRRLRYLGADERRTMEEAERSGRFDTPEFRAAEARYLELFCAGEPDESSPECLRRPQHTGRESYLAAWGDNELMPSGTLAGFEYAGRLKEVRCPALVVSGTQDLCSPLVAKQLADGIPGARWELFEGCRHACFVEDTPRYLAMLREWLDEND